MRKLLWANYEPISSCYSASGDHRGAHPSVRAVTKHRTAPEIPDLSSAPSYRFSAPDGNMSLNGYN